MRLSLFATTLVSVALMFGAAALAQEPPRGERSGADILRDAEQIMRELADEHLPNEDVGKATQEKEEEVIKSLEELIEKILEQQARQRQNQNGSEGKGSGQEQKPSRQPGGGQEPAPNVRLDTPTGNWQGSLGPSDDKSTARQKDEWGFLPDKDYDSTAEGASPDIPPGYKKLIERYRKVFANEAVKIRR
jgi:TolA-binding protein